MENFHSTRSMELLFAKYSIEVTFTLLWTLLIELLYAYQESSTLISLIQKEKKNIFKKSFKAIIFNVFKNQNDDSSLTTHINDW